MKGLTFMLHQEIEDLNMQAMYESHCHKVKLQFVRIMFIGCNGSNELVTMDQYNSLKANIHKDIVGYRDALIPVINNKSEEHYEYEETILCALKQ